MSRSHSYPEKRRSQSEMDAYLADLSERNLAAIRAGQAPLPLGRSIAPGRAAAIYAAEDQLFVEMIKAGKLPVFRRRRTPDLPPELLQAAKALAGKSTAPPPSHSEEELADLQIEFTELVFEVQALEAEKQRLQRENAELRGEIQRLKTAVAAPPKTGRPRGRSGKSTAAPKPARLGYFEFSKDSDTQAVSGLTAHWFRPGTGGIFAPTEATALARALCDHLKRESRAEQGYLAVIYLDSACASIPVFELTLPGGIGPTSRPGKNQQQAADASFARLVFEFKRSLRHRFCIHQFPDEPGAFLVANFKHTKFAYLRTQHGVLAVSCFADFADQDACGRTMAACIAALSHLAYSRDELSGAINRSNKPEWHAAIAAASRGFRTLEAGEYQRWDSWRYKVGVAPWPSRLTKSPSP